MSYHCQCNVNFFCRPFCHLRGLLTLSIRRKWISWVQVLTRTKRLWWKRLRLLASLKISYPLCSIDVIYTPTMITYFQCSMHISEVDSISATLQNRRFIVFYIKACNWAYLKVKWLQLLSRICCLCSDICKCRLDILVFLGEEYKS